MTPGNPVPQRQACAGLLPSTMELLVQGGDGRIALDPVSGINKYGCRPLPDDELAAFGSSTASVISEAGFAAADDLRRRILLAAGSEAEAAIYTREVSRMRRELADLCGVGALDGVECVLAASGTDLHLIAAQLAAGVQGRPPLVVMVDAAETGSGVPAALGAPAGNGMAAEVIAVALRCDDGSVRAMAEVDAEVGSLVRDAVNAGRRVLLVMADQSKTGMIAPSPACVATLHCELAEHVEVLVDACQFRLAPATVRAYIEHGFMVALTGSKFVGGPSFSGVLLIPPSSARRFRWRPLPRILAACSRRAEWPASWAAANALDDAANFGLLLRWEAALEELRRFRALPEAGIAAFLQSFSDAVSRRLDGDASFEPLPVPRLERGALLETVGWDCVQTIFPFLLYRTDAGDRKVLNNTEIQQVYRLLQTALPGAGGLRCQLGQPVACGWQDGVPVSALRLCLSARLVTEALRGKEQAERVVAQALASLDKAALIVAAMK